MKVLIADKFQQSGVDALLAIGCEVEHRPDLTAETLPQAIAEVNPETLIVRSTKVTEAALGAADDLNLIIRAGAGYDTIDVAAASSRGVFVANCPGQNSIAVAELTWGLILSCDRRLAAQTADLKAGLWNKKEYSNSSGLFGRTLGIIGLGRIGREVAKRGKAFGMNIHVWSRRLTPEEAELNDWTYSANPIDVARASDVITIHVAATPETANLVNTEFCQALKPGATLINTSRGSIVDEEALAQAMDSKGIRAGLDVYANEPAAGQGEFHNDLAHRDGLCGTHHIGASTDQAQEAIADETVRIIHYYLTRGQVLNCVNIAGSTPATNVLTIRMLNKPGVLAHVFYILGQAEINVEEMDNVIYEGAVAACAHIQLDEPPGEDLLTAICANPNILSASVSSI